MRPIDADVLLKEIEEEIEAEKSYDNYDKGVTAGLRIALRDIKKQTTIEAEPVKHGRWKERHYMKMKWIPSRFDNVSPEDVDIEPMVELRCSKCHLWSVNFRNHIELKYCPMCGARMDGGDE